MACHTQPPTTNVTTGRQSNSAHATVAHQSLPVNFKQRKHLAQLQAAILRVVEQVVRAERSRQYIHDTHCHPAQRVVSTIRRSTTVHSHTCYQLSIQPILLVIRPVPVSEVITRRLRPAEITKDLVQVVARPRRGSASTATRRGHGHTRTSPSTNVVPPCAGAGHATKGSVEYDLPAGVVQSRHRRKRCATHVTLSRLAGIEEGACGAALHGRGRGWGGTRCERCGAITRSYSRHAAKARGYQEIRV